MATTLRALVVYESMFGNTERVAWAVAEGLESEGTSVMVREVNRMPTVVPSDIDLLVVGAPTHAFTLSHSYTRADAVRQGASPHLAHLGLREWLSACSAHTGSGIASFDTRTLKVRWLPAAGRAAARIARQRGFKQLSKPVGFVVEDTKGPLTPTELERAVQWGRMLAGVARTHVAAERRSAKSLARDRRSGNAQNGAAGDHEQCDDVRDGLQIVPSRGDHQRVAVGAVL